jgi:hypothetical protein
MRAEDYKQMIYESFLYSGYAIKDFFSKRLKESGFSSEVFLRGLNEAYKEIKQYLDSRISPPVWTEDENGNKEFIKNTINLLHVTNNLIRGTIWSGEDLMPVFIAIKEMEVGLLSDKVKQLKDSDQIEIRKDWSELFNKLGGTIKGELTMFNDVMNFHRLPIDKRKIIWIGKKSEALYFQESFGFTLKEFNDCFVPQKGGKFNSNNRSQVNPKGSFLAIIKVHQDQ